MEFRLTSHAMEQMAERLVTEAMVDAVLANPVRSPATGRRTRYDGLVPDGRRLTVVVDESREPLRVVTVWWTQEGR